MPRPAADSLPRGLESATATVASGPICSVEQNRGRRPQRPGNQPRSRALSGFAPRQFTLENHRLPLALPQSFGSSGTSRFAPNTLSHIVAPRKTKTLPTCAETVEDEISLWKTEENCELIFQPDFGGSTTETYSLRFLGE